jgi:hypothetical protein
MGCAGSLYPAVQEIFLKDTGVFLEYSGKTERGYLTIITLLTIHIILKLEEKFYCI